MRYGSAVAGTALTVTNDAMCVEYYSLGGCKRTAVGQLNELLICGTVGASVTPTFVVFVTLEMGAMFGSPLQVVRQVQTFYMTPASFFQSRAVRFCSTTGLCKENEEVVCNFSYSFMFL